MPSGGRRPGAGRKPRAEKHAQPVAAAEQRIRDRLPEILDNLFHLADGGYLRVREKREPAGLIFVEDVEEIEGEDGKIKTLRTKRRAFPDLDPKEMVVV